MLSFSAFCQPHLIRAVLKFCLIILNIHLECLGLSFPEFNQTTILVLKTIFSYILGLLYRTASCWIAAADCCCCCWLLLMLAALFHGCILTWDGHGTKGPLAALCLAFLTFTWWFKLLFSYDLFCSWPAASDDWLQAWKKGFPGCFHLKPVLPVPTFLGLRPLFWLLQAWEKRVSWWLHLMPVLLVPIACLAASLLTIVGLGKRVFGKPSGWEVGTSPTYHRNSICRRWLYTLPCQRLWLQCLFATETSFIYILHHDKMFGSFSACNFCSYTNWHFWKCFFFWVRNHNQRQICFFQGPGAPP